ncbi:MAG: DUF4124 domain-containing protein [Pseudomonadota bacterium]
MRRCHGKVLSLTLVALMATSQSGNAERLYKWKDENGVVRYGDRVPPQYAKQDVKILNEYGVVVQEVEGVKTPEELAAEAAKREKEEAILREVEAKKQYDMMLLETYSSVAEIEAERDRRVSAVDAQITQANRQIRLLQSKIARLELEARSYGASQQNAATIIPEPIVDDMEESKLALNDYEAQLRGFYVAQADLRLKFNGDMVRFRELKRASR